MTLEIYFSSEITIPGDSMNERMNNTYQRSWNFSSFTEGAVFESILHVCAVFRETVLKTQNPDFGDWFSKSSKKATFFQNKSRKNKPSESPRKRALVRGGN